MAMQAELLSIQRVENGWLVEIYCAGSSVKLVAKAIEEVIGYLRGMEWQTPRPINYGEIQGGGIPGNVPAPMPSTLSIR